MMVSTATSTPMQFLEGSPVSLLDDFSAEMTAKDVDALRRAAPLLSPGTNISVTFLPGEDHEARVAAATLVRQLGLNPIPHISARRLSSIEELDFFLGALSVSAQIDRAFVVGGDCEPKGPFPDALSVIRSGRLAAYGIDRIGISGYPEGHATIPIDVLWRDMRDKHDELLDRGHQPVITTQFSFDSDAVVLWIREVRRRGFDSTIRVGVPGPAGAKSLLRFAARCGVSASAKVMQKYGFSLTRLLSVTGPDRFLTDLAAALDPSMDGNVRLHLYPFGGLDRTAEWVRAFRGA